MKVVEFEKALTGFDDYPDGVDVYYFYIQTKMDNEWFGTKINFCTKKL